MRRIVVTGCVLGVLAVAVAGWTSMRGRAKAEDAAIGVDATQAEGVPALGEVRAVDAVNVGCPAVRHMWEFSITRIVDEGTEVSTGDVLLAFDSQKLNDRLQLQQSRLEKTRKELERTILEQEQRLSEFELEQSRIVSDGVRLARKLAVPAEIRKGNDVETTKIEAEFNAIEQRVIAERIEVQRANKRARIEAAENRVAKLEREVGDLQDAIRRMTVRAQRSGYIVHVPDWNGEKPKQGESVWHGRTLLRIAELSELEVSAEVAEKDAGRVRLGQRVEVRLDAAPDKLFTGRIAQLGRLFRTKSWDTPSKIFDATVELDAPDAALMRPGMAAGLIILPDDDAANTEPAS